jgi:Pumilio-family RNA binding repeat
MNLKVDVESSNNEILRKIWTPLSTCTRVPQKSKSTNNLLRVESPPPAVSAVKIPLPEPAAAVEVQTPAPVPVVPSLSQTEVKDLKASFKSYVDKIVKTNDQTCSIFLQQRLKTEQSDEVKALIYDSIMAQVLPLMKNRFGNFLVQCCLDCGTLDQFNSLCMKMKGHVVHLASDRFGCHVMQKVTKSSLTKSGY